MAKGSYNTLNSYWRQDVELNSYYRQDAELNSYWRQDVELTSYFTLEDLAEVGQVQTDSQGRIIITHDGRKIRVYN